MNSVIYRLHRPGWRQAAWLVLLAAGLALALGAEVRAQDAECIKKNQKFAGATATCARAICTWQACVDRIMLQGKLDNIPLANKEAFKAQSERDSALATCKPHEQVMTQCLAAARPPKWCKTGHDRDRKGIDEKGRALKAKYDALMAKYRPRRKAYDESLKQWRPRWNAVRAEAKAYMADKRKLSKEALHAKWEASGRRPRGVAQFRALRAERDKLRAEFQEMKAMDKQRNPMRETLKKLQEAWDARDCARAAQIIGLN